MQKMLRLGVRFITAGNEWAFMVAAARQPVAADIVVMIFEEWRK
jgi:hypothetical protein